MARHVQVRPDLVIPDAEIDEQASLSGGPGGQHANTTESRITLRWNVRNSAVLTSSQRNRILKNLSNRINSEGELVLHADDTRSQHQNRNIARERLADMVREAVKKKKKRRRTRPTRGSNERRLRKKKHRGRIKDKRGRLRGHEDI